MTFAAARALMEKNSELQQQLVTQKRQIDDLTTELTCTRKRWSKAKADLRHEHESHRKCVDDFNNLSRRFDRLVNAMRAAGGEDMLRNVFANDSAELEDIC